MDRVFWAKNSHYIGVGGTIAVVIDDDSSAATLAIYALLTESSVKPKSMVIDYGDFSVSYTLEKPD